MITKSVAKHITRKSRRPKFNVDVENLLWLPGNVAVFWKNSEGHYLGCNDIAADSVKLNSRHEIVDKSDFDLPILQDEAQMMRNGDIKVMQKAKPMQFYYTCTMSDKKVDLLSFKAPLYNADGNIVGVYGIDNFLAIQNLNQSLNTLMNAKIDSDYIKSIYRQSSPTKLLTKRQCECLYYLVKGKTIKKIAHILNLSPKTVEHYLDAVKTKLNCYTRAELIEKALQLPFIRDNL